MAMKIYREVKLIDRLPDIGLKHVTTFASRKSGSTTFTEVTQRVQEFISENKEYWLEEIELPSDGEIGKEGFENSTCVTAFWKGANYILNKLK